MSAAEYRVILDRLGLDVASAGRVPGIDGADSVRWAAGTLAVPDDVVRMLRGWMRSGVTPDEIRRALEEE